jgi:hypothetical protein
MFGRSHEDRRAPKSDPKPSSAQAQAQAPLVSTQRNDQQTATVRYEDRPDCAETFADSIQSVLFDGQTLRIEFAITRFDDIKSGAPVTGRRYPACRLVLPPSAAVDLINKVQQIANGLAQAGLVKQAAPNGQKD